MDTILGILMVGLGCFGLGALVVLVLTHGSTVWWEEDSDLYPDTAEGRYQRLNATPPRFPTDDDE